MLCSQSDDVLSLIANRLDESALAAVCRTCITLSSLSPLSQRLQILWDASVAALTNHIEGDLSCADRLCFEFLGERDIRVLASVVRRGGAPCVNRVHIASGDFSAPAAHALLDAAAADFGLTVALTVSRTEAHLQLGGQGSRFSNGCCVLLAHTWDLCTHQQQALLRLDLRANRIGREGGCALAAALARGHAPLLRRLMLGRNELERSAGVALVRSLTATPCLRALELECNYLPDAPLEALAAMLVQRSPTLVPLLRRLDVSGNSSSAGAQAALRRACEAERDGAQPRKGHGKVGAPLQRLLLLCDAESLTESTAVSQAGDAATCNEDPARGATDPKREAGSTDRTGTGFRESSVRRRVEASSVATLPCAKGRPRVEVAKPLEGRRARRRARRENEARAGEPAAAATLGRSGDAEKSWPYNGSRRQ